MVLIKANVILTFGSDRRRIPLARVTPQVREDGDKLLVRQWRGTAGKRPVKTHEESQAVRLIGNGSGLA